MKQIMKDAAVLFVITLVAGILLGTVYETTLAARQEQTEKAEAEAYREVFSEGIEFLNVEFSEEEAEKALEEKEITPDQAQIDKVAAAYGEDNDFIGYAITVTDKEGYGGSITLIVGILADGTVNGISITSISETAGLGMNAKKDSFKNQYAGVKTDAFTVEKNSSGEDHDSVIDAISGATVTSNAVTNGVNSAIAMFWCLDGETDKPAEGR